MDAFEYLVKEENFSPMSENFLNDYGKNGWELIFIRERKIPTSSYPKYDHYFKRKKV